MTQHAGTSISTTAAINRWRNRLGGRFRFSLGQGERVLKRVSLMSALPRPLLLQVDGLIMPGLVELCAPHLVHALVIGATERHGRPEPNVEIAEIFESAY
jgi:hypothetical protein